MFRYQFLCLGNVRDVTKGEVKFGNDLGTLLAKLIAMCAKESEFQQKMVPRYVYVIINPEARLFNQG